MSHTPEITNRVFCIGMNKTGTSTMKHCFEALRLSPIASPVDMDRESWRLIKQFYRDRNYEPILDMATHYRSFEDRPWNMWEMYRYLDKRFPDSRFILTVRDPELWWRSTERWINVTNPTVSQRYQLHLRSPDTSKSNMIASYIRHNKEIEAYFKGTGKLLVFNPEAGDGWDKLCQFLGVPVPDRDFPHANRQSYTADDEIRMERIRQRRSGIKCQSCGHITPVSVNSRPRVRGASTASERGQTPNPARVVHDKLKPLLQRLSAKLAPSAARLGHLLHSLWSALESKLPSSKRREDALTAATLDDKEFAAVSCFFNPGGSRRRVENFRKFHSGIRSSGVRCLVVELAFGAAPFQLDPGEDVVQLRTHDVMWHKEKLLNIGIEKLLEEGYEKIAWLDGDITFDRNDWPVYVARELDNVNLCQVFSTVSVAGDEGECPEIGTSSIKYFLERGSFYTQSPMHVIGIALGRLRGGQSGFGWAARAEVLREVMLYDKAIVGGGDKLILAASLASDLSDQQLQELTHSSLACEVCGHRNRSEAYTLDFLNWAQRWSAAVGGRVGYARLHISDMYHGKRADRKYMTRRDLLYRHQFNPTDDLTEDNAGLLAWATGKPGFHNDVESYFLSRREDT